MADIGKAVRLALANKGDRQKAVALATGVPESTISNTTNNKIKPTIETLSKLAVYFDMKLSELIALGE